MSDDRQKRIEQRAYEIWDREGRRSGMDAENWRRAEAEIAQEEEAGALTSKGTEPSETAVSTEVAEPANLAASTEPAVETAEPAAKPTKSRARTKPEAKPDEPEAVSQVRKSGGKDKAPDEETQEKDTRKRKTPTKKK